MLLDVSSIAETAEQIFASFLFKQLFVSTTSARIMHNYCDLKSVFLNLKVNIIKFGWDVMWYNEVNGVKGTVARDLWPLVFFMNRPHMGP